jgi:hypothetical protein
MEFWQVQKRQAKESKNSLEKAEGQDHSGEVQHIPIREG